MSNQDNKLQIAAILFLIVSDSHGASLTLISRFILLAYGRDYLNER